MAATEYFRRTSSDQLKIAFQPIVHDSISKVAVVKQHDHLQQGCGSRRRIAANASFLMSQDIEQSLQCLAEDECSERAGSGLLIGFRQQFGYGDRY